MDRLMYQFMERFLTTLCEYEEFRVTVEGSLKDGLLAGFCTIIGGLLGGSQGAVLGAAAGAGVLGVRQMTNGDRYRSLRDVLRDEFTEQERQELYSKLIQMLKAVIIRPENVMGIAQAADDLADFVRHNADVMEDVKRILQQFLSKRSYNLA